MVKTADLAFNEEESRSQRFLSDTDRKVVITMPGKSIFFDEWRNCLQAHYQTFVQQEYLPQPERKTHARESLEGVLHRVGFSDDDLHDLYVRATMRVEDVPDNFMPDLTFQAHPTECQCLSCMDAALSVGHDAAGQPLEIEPEPMPEPDAAGNLYPVAKRATLFQMDDLDDEPEPLPQEAETVSKGKRKSKKAGEVETPKPRRQSMF